MQTKHIDPLSDPTLAKLLEVDSDLAAQEANLTIQLQEIQQKRSSLKIVVSLFMPEETLAAPATQAPEALLSVQATVEETDLVPPPIEPMATPVPSNDDEIQEQRAQTPRLSRTQVTERRTKSPRRALAPTPSRKAESWRPYVRGEVEASAALPKIVAKVLQRLPKHVFAVPEIMNAIFVDEIPKEAYKIARSRILSILSKGVKENQWQRSNKGQYRSSAVGAETAVDALETNSEPEPEIDDQHL